MNQKSGNPSGSFLQTSDGPRLNGSNYLLVDFQSWW
jgi:hypothetical protein